MVLAALMLFVPGCTADTETTEESAESEEALRSGCLQYWFVDDVAAAKNATPCWSSSAFGSTDYCIGPWREIDLKKGQKLTMRAGSPDRNISGRGSLTFWQLTAARVNGLVLVARVDVMAGQNGSLEYTAPADVRLRLGTSYGFRRLPHMKLSRPPERLIEIRTC
jgi:hypothetical protein